MPEETPDNLLHPRSVSDAGGADPSSHGVSINLPPGAQDGRPAPVKHVSAPAYQSPIRHHQRTASRTKGVKETLNARSHYGSSDDDGASIHRINQYIIKQEIGRGSFGSVHLAEDQYGNEYAVKEFSKSRLRKRAQSNLLRKPNHMRRPGQIAAGLGFNSPMHRTPSNEMTKAEAKNSLELIKEEIAIMKKLNHNNLVSLIEVLDDPQEDSLYMVLEMCKKGVAMKVGLEERAEPYDDETCRCWFRDMILGIEYLHAQGVVHRDIKPDNCLITNDDVLKIVDFGVSEMFEKQSEMATTKSAGSPAFMPPELCVARHGQISGRAADIWSMGVTLYCFRYGHIPFERNNMLDLYDSIRADDVPLQEEKDPNFTDLMRRMLEKDPEKRITMEDIRNHPWVTKEGTDTLLSVDENCADLVEPPTEVEMNHAITDNMGHVMAVMSAAKRFKNLLHGKRGRLMESVFGGTSRLVAPPSSMRTDARSQDTYDRRPMDQVLAAEGIHRQVEIDEDLRRIPHDMDKMGVQNDAKLVLDRQDPAGETDAIHKQRKEALRHHGATFSEHTDEHHPFMGKRAKTFPVEEHAKGHAHDPLEDVLFLDIGSDPTSEGHDGADTPIVSSSPPAVDFNIYEQAYQDEMQKILDRRGREPSIYLNRRLDHREDIRRLANIKDAGKEAVRYAAARADDLYNKGYATGGIVSDKVRGGTASNAEGLDAWKKLATDVASSSKVVAKGAAKGTADKIGGLYARSGGLSGGLSNLVTQAQAKKQDEDPDEGIVNSPDQISASDFPPGTTSGSNSNPNAAQTGSDQRKGPTSTISGIASLLKKG